VWRPVGKEIGQRAAQRGEDGGPAVAQSAGERPQVTGPGGRADQSEGGLPQLSEDEEAVHDLDRTQPLQHRTAGGQGADAQGSGKPPRSRPSPCTGIRSPKASQIQLAQPPLTVVWSVLLMGGDASLPSPHRLPGQGEDER
jgi:hypothetical protein